MVESCFSNTRSVAEAVATGLRGQGVVVALLEAAEQSWPLAEIDLLVVGAPVHHRSLPNRFSRALAATQGARTKPFGLADWLKEMPAWEGGEAAVFDCARGHGAIHGSAVPAMTRKLGRQGVPVVSSARFLTEAMEGPVSPVDLDRARRWGAELAALGGKSGQTAQFWIPSAQRRTRQEPSAG